MADAPNTGERLARLEEQNKSQGRELSELKRAVVYKDVFTIFQDELGTISKQIRDINRFRYRMVGAVVVLSFVISTIVPIIQRWWTS